MVGNPIPADGELLQRFQTGEQAAFDQLVDRYQVRLLRFAARTLGNGERAEDVVQETFLRLLRKTPDKAVNGAIGPWLFRVCRNYAYDLMKLESREKQRREKVAKEEAVQASSSDAERAELRVFVAQALEKLPPKQREVVRLKVQEGLSYREISEVTGLKTGYIGWLVHTGLEALTERLRSAGAL